MLFERLLALLQIEFRWFARKRWARSLWGYIVQYMEDGQTMLKYGVDPPKERHLSNPLRVLRTLVSIAAC